MKIEEQFSELILQEKSKQFTPFLQALTPDQKKLLTPVIKKLTKQFFQWGQINSSTWTHNFGTDKQRGMLELASFVCFNMADFEKSPSPLWFIREQNLKTILNWYIPSWLNDYINKTAAVGEFSLDYNWIMQLTEKTGLQPSKELLVKSMPQMIFENRDRLSHYAPHNLLKWPVTLKKHIWYLFEVDSNIHAAERYLHFGKGISKEDIGWNHTLIELSNSGKIERKRLLKEALLASNRNFNKVLSGWFIQLFIDLEPSQREILALQNELLSVLSSPHSKVINASLGFTRTIIDKKEFDARSFMDNVPTLLASDTKATVLATLNILEDVSGKKKDKTIAALVIQAFIHSDKAIQAKASAIFNAIADPDDISLRDQLEPYRTTMLSTTKEFLKTFLGAPPQQAGKTDDTAGFIQKESMLIPAVETIDDLIFLASQVCDHNEDWHIAVFPNELIKWQDRLVKGHLDKFEPALQRALKMMKGRMNANQGMLDHMFATFLIDVCVDWVREYPSETPALAALFEKFKQVNGPQVNRWTEMTADSAYLIDWKDHYNLPIYTPHRLLLLDALQKLRRKDTLPMLSAPTHLPGLIDPVVLTERLIRYQENKRQPSSMDLQVAVSRCHLTMNPGKAIRLAEDKLQKEFKHLLLFLLGKDAMPQKPFEHPEAWMMASLAIKEKKTYPEFKTFPWYKKQPGHYTGYIDWKHKTDTYEITDFDKTKSEHIKKKKERVDLEVTRDYLESRDSVFQRTVLRSGDIRNQPESNALCDLLEWNVIFVGGEHNNIRRVLLLVPNNPEPLLADITAVCMRHSTFSDEDSKRVVIAALQLMQELPYNNLNETAHLFIGTCMMASDKTVQSLAAEIWISEVNNNQIQNDKLGGIISRHAGTGFAPIKRFTDLVEKQLFRISAKHDQALLLVIQNILKHLPLEPIANLKKLLEVFKEVLVVASGQISDQSVNDKLIAWKN